MKKKVFLILLCCLMMCSCSGVYEYFGEGGLQSDINELFGETLFEEEVSYKEPSKIEVSDYYTTPYDSSVERDLSESEVELYNLMCYYIERYDLSFHFDDVNEDEVINAYMAVMDDHPEYFWMNKGYRYTKTTLGTHTEIDFVPTSQEDVGEIAAKDAKFKTLVKSIAEEAAKLENIYDKVLYVHDFIVDNTTYDHEAAESNDKDDGYDKYFDSRNAYGCLINGKAVCSGYASAFQCIMKELEIPCGYITGQAVDGGEAHAWNYVKLGDYNYQIDVTWDDSSYTSDEGEKSERKSYDYFLITTEEAEITHIIDKDQNIPICSGLEYNYYIYNNLYFPEYDFDYVAYVIRDNVPYGSVTIKFGSHEECQAAYEDLIENDRIFRIDGVNGSISYIQGNNGLTLTFTF